MSGPVSASCTAVRAPNPGPLTLEGTNTWVLRGRDGGDGSVVVDPGPLHDGHLDALSRHAPVRLVLLTHGHLDHAAAARVFAERVGAPVRAVDPALCRGAEPLGDGPLTVAGLDLEVLLTPGHTGDSACFVLRDDDQAVVLTGDTILGRGSTVVAHPDGRLADYLRSLERLRDLGDLPVLPGHGPMQPSVAAAARGLLDHRRERLEQVRTARASGAGTVEELLDRVYADVPADLRQAAVWSLRAQLDYLDAADA